MTKPIVKFILGFLMAIILLAPTEKALAGSYTESFSNGFQTDAIYLFLYDDRDGHDVVFDQVTFNDASWRIAAENSNRTYLKLSGPVAGPGSLLMDVTFTDNRNGNRIIPLSMEWAEYLNGIPSASDAMGTIALERNRGSLGWVSSSAFNATVPTPVPASTRLLLSGLFFLVGVRRHARG